MTINPEIKEVLHRYKIPQDDALSYLISIYYNVRPSYTPPALIERIQRTNILGILNKTLTWNVTLFEEQPVEFGWVKQWHAMFAEKDKKRAGLVGEVTKRMQNFFKIYPDVRMQEVMVATENYIATVRDVQFLKSAPKFIFEGMGADKQSMLMLWVQMYRDTLFIQEDEEDIDDVSSRLQ